MRQWAIVQALLQANGRVTYDGLSEQSAMTVRVVRYNMSAVRAWFSSHGVKLVARSGYGIEIDASGPLRRHLLASLAHLVEQDMVLTGDQRRRAFIFRMLSFDAPTSFQNLAAQAGSSRSTLIHDVGKMGDWLGRFEIRILRRPKVGINLAAEEHTRRFALLGVLREELGEERWRRLGSADGGALVQDRSLPQYIRAYLRQLELPFYRPMITKLEHNFGRRLTPRSHVSALVYLAIMGRAIRAGSTVTERTADGIEGAIELEISMMLLRELSGHLGTEITRPEAVLLAALLLSLEWQGAASLPSGSAGPPVEGEALQLAQEIVSRCALQLHPLLQIDQELRSGLARHMQRALHRVRYGIPVRNALLEPLRARYSEVHRSAMQSMAEIEAETGLRFSADEVAFVTMYLAAALERIGTNRRFVRPVLLVAEGEPARTTLLVSRLESEFPNLEIVGVREPAEALGPDCPRAELIIALAPCEHPKIHTLQVSPLLSGEDIRSIRAWVATRESLERRAALSHRAKQGIVELLDPSSIVFRTTHIDWRASVGLAAAPLIEAGKIRPGYVQAMIQILEHFGPYMILAPGVILLHAKPSDGVDSLCFSLLMHRSGIDFGGDFGKVHVVFVLGAVDNQSHLTALFQLSNLVQTPGFVRRLRQAADAADALRTIWSYLTRADSEKSPRGAPRESSLDSTRNS
jgi:mannitol/fructose-specific phosphotransferase system IIA component (Ntr-type)